MVKKEGSKKKFQISLRKIILVFVIVLSFALVIYPFIPQLWYWIKFQVFDYDWKEHESVSVSITTDSQDEETADIYDYYLEIPVIGVGVDIVEGNDDSSLSKGVWHRPNTGDPVSGGNMVITGHRFQYIPPNNMTFYHLDKIVDGDEIIVYWDEIEYDYVVVETFIVEPEDVEIEEDTAYPVLTLYTCTPLWTASKRLVVRAEPVD